jgi:hypothetical protein
MSAQILLQGRLLGVENFLSSGAAGENNVVFEARTAWVTLLGEVLPRALLSTLQLPLLLLGTADRNEFLVILPDQGRADAAHDFLRKAASTITSATNSALRLIWSATENLGESMTAFANSATAFPSKMGSSQPSKRPRPRMTLSLPDFVRPAPSVSPSTSRR